MRFMDELRKEHELIEAVAGSFLHFVDALGRSEAALSIGQEYVAFFRVYAGQLHHDREEAVLLPALVNEAALPGNRGPVAVILADHTEMAKLLDEMNGVLSLKEPSREDLDGFSANAARYAKRLLSHIDAENSVLIPEGEARLAQAGVRELEVRAPLEVENKAALSGSRLVETYPPIEATDLIRGDGCVMCHAYGETCEGLEREWWNDNEWDECDEHIASS